MSQKSYVDDKIVGLSKILPSLKIVKSDAETLVTTINDISESSEKISGKIRSLDVARVSIMAFLLDLLYFTLGKRGQ